MKQQTAVDAWVECMGRVDGAYFARERLGLQPNAVQEELLSGQWGRVLLNCSRQWGKSTVTAAKAVHHAYYQPESLVMVVTPGVRQSAEFLKKAERFVRRLGLPVKRDAPHEVSVVFPNGARIIGLPANEDKIRGFSAVSLLLVDEASRVDNPMYDAVRPMLAVADGDLWLMSTPAGQDGFFWQEWAYGGPAWHRVTGMAAENPRIKKSFLAAERRSMTARMYQQEYECAFLDVDGTVIGRPVVERAVRTEVKALRGDPWGGERPWFGGEPVRQSEFVVGVDLGQKEDFTAIAVLERFREVVGPPDWKTGVRPTEMRYDVRHLERVPLGTEYGEIAARIGRIARCGDLRGRATIVVDATGVGAPVLELVQKEPMDCRVVPVVITGGEKQSLVGSTYRVPRQDLLSGVVVGMEQRWLRIAHDLEEGGSFAKEMVNLRSEIGLRGEKWVGRSGKVHDDLVFAVSLACWWARRR